MIQILNDKHVRIGLLETISDLVIESVLEFGDKKLTFKYPQKGKQFKNLKNEYYLRTKTDEYVLKSISIGEDKNEYIAQLNIEELESKQFTKGYERIESTISDCLNEVFENTTWKLSKCDIAKKRTIRKDSQCTAWEILKDCISTYRAEIQIDSLNKIIHIYEQIGSDKGSYFVEGLNLKKISKKITTYDFFNVIIPYGKDNIGIDVLGKNYIENFQYTCKRITRTWKDERYTNTTALYEDAKAKLEEASKPVEAYTADVIKLAEQSDKYRIIDYEIGDTVSLISKTSKIKTKQRIVKTVEYPQDPSKNSVELSNVKKTFAELQKKESETTKQEAIDISNGKTNEKLGNYYTKEELETKIVANESSILLEVKKTYQTSTQVQNKINKSLESYMTTEETKSAIKLESTSITLEVSKTYQTSTQVQNKINKSLESYMTTEETKSAIKLESTSITLEVSKTYQTNTQVQNKIKNALDSYMTTEETKSAIKIESDSISTEVSKKVNNTEIGTKIIQNAYAVRVAWNDTSKYIQLEYGQLAIYDGDVQASKRRAVFDENGNHFYRDGYYVGKIGTNYYLADSSKKGLVFDLEYDAAFMSWTNEKSTGASAYTMRWTYVNKAFANFEANRLYAGCDVDLQYNCLRNVNFEGGGITGKLVFVQPISMNTDGTIARWSNGCTLEFKNGILIGGSWYS